MTFLCGRAGVCALGAVVAKEAGDEDLLNHYLSSFRDVRLRFSAVLENFIDQIAF